MRAETESAAKRQVETERARSEELARRLEEQSSRLKKELEEQRKFAIARNEEAGGGWPQRRDKCVQQKTVPYMWEKGLAE